MENIEKEANDRLLKMAKYYEVIKPYLEQQLLLKNSYTMQTVGRAGYIAYDWIDKDALDVYNMLEKDILIIRDQFFP